MKVLLIIPKDVLSNEQNLSYFPFPLALPYLSSILKQHGHTVHGLNMNHKSGSSKKILSEYLANTDYDVIGIGHGSMEFTQIKHLVSLIRKHASHSKIVIGGMLVTSEPEMMFEYFKPDFLMLGEGELSFPKLLDALDNKISLTDVPNLFYKEDGIFVTTKSTDDVIDLDTLPYPDYDEFEFSDWLDHLYSNIMDAYAPKGDLRYYSIIGSRGCPYNCSFCFHHKGYRLRSIDSMIEELKYAIDTYNINYFMILDDLFSNDIQRVIEFCTKFKKLSSNYSHEIRWACMLNVRNFNDELASVLKESNAETLVFGFESMSPEVLKSMRKPIKPEQIDKCVKLVLKYKFNLMANFIFGDKAETLDTARQTLNYWRDNTDQQVKLRFVIPYSGSEIYHHAITAKKYKKNIRFLTSVFTSNPQIKNITNLSWFSFLKLYYMVQKHEGKYSKYSPLNIVKQENGFASIKFTCPYCNKSSTIDKFLVRSKFYLREMIVCPECLHNSYLTTGVAKYVMPLYPFYKYIMDHVRYLRIKVLRLFSF